MIDAHQHCWQLGAHDCTWPTPELPKIFRDFDVPELQTVAQPLGVSGSVLVQSQARDADTDYLLALAHKHKFVKAVVGWVDLTAPAAPQRIARLASHPKLRGLRPMLQALPDDDWILRPELEPTVEAMIEQRLSFDALVFTRHLRHLRTFATRFPQLPIVIDHGAKPPIAANERAQFQRWSDAMSRLADLPQVHCKISGLLTEAGPGQEVDVLNIYLTRLLELFGAERLLWGSDWPVVNIAPNRSLANYAAWFKFARDFFMQHSAAQTRAIFGENAQRFYRI